jgi:hypothetical protein
VYGDNFFWKASFTLHAARLTNGDVTEDLHATDKSILQKRDELKDFEKEFLQVCTAQCCHVFAD